MEPNKLIRAAVVVVAALHPFAAHAYLGPGVGAGALGAVIAVLGAIVLGIVGVVYYPIKRFLKSRRRAADPGASDGSRVQDPAE